MKLNRKWINEEFVDLSQVSDQEFVETMTLAGQYVETYESLDGELRNVVVGKVLSLVRHPNSDHMWICQVDVGRAEPVQMVTGAQNVRDGTWFLPLCTTPGSLAASTSPRASSGVKSPTACSAP